MKLSPETFVAGMNRNEEWLRALESGEIELTKEMVEDIGVALNRAGQLTDVERIAADLQDYPLGSEGLRLRGLAHPVHPPRSDDSSPPGFGSEAIAGVDRILVVGPGVIILAFLTLVARMLVWTLTSTRLDSNERAAREPLAELLDAVLLPSVVVATLFLALGLLFGDRVLRSAAASLRPALCSKDLGVIKQFCEVDGIETPDEADWKLEFLQPYLIERHRARVASSAMRTAFSERAVPALAASVVLALAGAATAILKDGLSWYDLGPISLIVVGVGLVVLARRETVRSSAECAAEVSRGLGWKLGRAQERGLRETQTIL